MGFDVFFEGNIYILFGILIYMLFNSDRHKEYNSKIIVIYSLILFFYLTDFLNLYYMLGIFLFLFFCQFELFINDKFKHKIVTNLFDKICDCLYLLVFQYRFILYLIFLYVVSNINFNNFDYNSLYPLLTSIAIYIYLLLFISSSKFELNTFDKIIEKLNPKSFADFVPIDDDKKNILVELEDKTYFYRNKSHNFISFWILIFKIRTMINLIINHKERKMDNGDTKRTLKEKVLRIWYFIRRQIRGYSTLEMQLYRQIAVKDGYNEKGQRKIAEIVYSQILFKSFKQYLKRNYDIVSFERYKMFLIDKYLRSAPVFLGNHKFSNYYELFKKHDVSNCDFLFYVLCLPGKLDKEDIICNNEIDIDLFRYKYAYYLWQFNISDKELEKTIKWFNKKRKV